MFEYKEKLIYEDNYIELLNEEGKEGWQVVNTESGYKIASYDAHRILFMRQKTKEVDNG